MSTVLVNITAMLFSSMSANAVVGPSSQEVNTNYSAAIVKLVNEDQTHRCGGVLVAEGVVLTARHCTTEVPFKVQFPKSQYGDELFEVERILRTDAIVRDATLSFTDWALLKLSSNPDISQIPITTKNEEDLEETLRENDALFLMGFMNAKSAEETPAPGVLMGGSLLLSEILPGIYFGQEIKIDVIKYSTLPEIYSPSVSFASTQLWTVGGDSGSPLICGDEINPQVCGVVSTSGIMFEDGRHTSHYQFVSTIYTWIDENLRELSSTN